MKDPEDLQVITHRWWFFIRIVSFSGECKLKILEHLIFDPWYISEKLLQLQKMSFLVVLTCENLPVRILGVSRALSALP